jgi:UDP-N-acetylglucosamine--dolichyl-phosphate N-acetylglucosaminephosphotransferase
MDQNGIALAAALAFASTLIGIPLWIRHRHLHGLLGKDMHKKSKPLVAEQGGVVVALGVLIGALSYVAIEVIGRGRPADALLLAGLTSFLLAAFLGLIDGLLGWRSGLGPMHKLALSALIPLPLMALNAGTHFMHVPFIGKVELGVAYALAIIPLGVIGASNGFNMLAGYNGLEAGLGAIILGTLTFISWHQGAEAAVLLGATATAALLAFLLFNRPPSSVFPGDSLTYATGTMTATLAILANIEAYALILFLPYFAEFFLKARAGFTQGRSASRWLSIARVLPDGSLATGKSWCTLPHLVIALLRKLTGRATETQTVLALWAAETLLAASAVTILIF